MHFAGHPREQSFEEIVADTLPAAYHVFEGARRHGARRVVYASSIHAVGFYPVEAVPDTRVMHRPDTFYGLTKTFIEDLASLYWDKFGIESVCLRICSCFPEPEDRRMLWSWLSFADCVRLVEAALTAPRVGFSVIYGTSDNAAARRLERPRHATSASGRGQRRRLRRRGPGAAPSGPIRRPSPRRVVGGGFAAHRPSRRCRLTPPGLLAPRSLATWPRRRDAGGWAPGRSAAATAAATASRRRRSTARTATSRAAEAAMRAWGQRPLFMHPPRRRGARRRAGRARLCRRDPDADRRRGAGGRRRRRRASAAIPGAAPARGDGRDLGGGRHRPARSSR